MALKEWYAANADRINGIATANNTNIEVAKGMLEDNAKGTGKWAGGGVADMSELYKSYQSATADGQAKFNNRNSSGRSRSSTSKSKTNPLMEAYQKQIEEAYKEAARQAYIGKMQSQLQMGDYLASQGYSGGVSETTLAGLNSEYGNALATAQGQKADSQLGLLQTQQDQANYQAEQDFARQQYQNQLAQYNQEYADSQSAMAFDNAYKLYAAGVRTPAVLKALGIGDGTVATNAAVGSRSGGSPTNTPDTPTTPTTQSTGTPFTDLRQSLLGGTGNVENTALQNLTKMYKNGEIDITTYKQRLGKIGFTTDGTYVTRL